MCVEAVASINFSFDRAWRKTLRCCRMAWWCAFECVDTYARLNIQDCVIYSRSHRWRNLIKMSIEFWQPTAECTSKSMPVFRLGYDADSHSQHRHCSVRNRWFKVDGNDTQRKEWKKRTSIYRCVRFFSFSSCAPVFLLPSSYLSMIIIIRHHFNDSDSRMLCKRRQIKSKEIKQQKIKTKTAMDVQCTPFDIVAFHSFFAFLLLHPAWSGNCISLTDMHAGPSTPQRIARPAKQMYKRIRTVCTSRFIHTSYERRWGNTAVALRVSGISSGSLASSQTFLATVKTRHIAEQCIQIHFQCPTTPKQTHTRCRRNVSRIDAVRCSVFAACQRYCSTVAVAQKCEQIDIMRSTPNAAMLWIIIYISPWEAWKRLQTFWTAQLPAYARTVCFCEHKSACSSPRNAARFPFPITIFRFRFEFFVFVFIFFFCF